MVKHLEMVCNVPNNQYQNCLFSIILPPGHGICIHMLVKLLKTSVCV